MPLCNNRKVIERGIRIKGQKFAGGLLQRFDIAMAIGKLGNSRQSFALVV